MLLKSVEIFGFKSFPRKTQIRLDSGITALVGPNGCGKSNIVDAIRWALGEQRPNILRCDRMHDIIFGGTQARRSLGLAEVTLSFVNDGKLSLDFEEIEVTRRLYRSGESEYLLNRAPCRHKDIVDLFLNTGLSSKAYAMITVDMIDKILKSDPQLRRDFFEEAAGISKYRATRNLAVRKLYATEEDLLRVNDIILEIERTCRSLKRQAGKARRYRRLKKELKQLEAAHLIAKFDELREAREKLKEQRAKLESDRNSTMEGLAAREDAFRKKKEELKEKEAEYSAVLTKLEKTREDVTRIERDLAIFKERKKSLQESLDRLSRDRSEIERRIPSVEEHVEAARSELDQLKRNIEVAESRLEQKSKSLRHAEEEVSSLLLEKEDVTKKLERTQTEENDKRKTCFALEAQEEAYLGRLEGLRDESKDLEDQLRMLSWHLHDGINQVNGFSATLKKYEDKLDEFGRVIEDARRSKNALAEREGGLRQKLLTAKSELDLLNVFEQRKEGHRASARALLGKRNPGSRYSTLADLIEVPDEYAQAIEGALEIGLSTLITENEKDVVTALEFLSKNKKGRAAFAPLSLLRPPPAPPVPVDDATVWLASDYVKCDQAYEPVIKALLGRFILCEDLKTALDMFKRGSHPQFYLLTKSGEVIEPTGIIRGGSRSEQPLLGRARRIQSLEKDVPALEKYRSNVEHELLKKEVRIQKLQAEFSKLDEDYQDEIRKRVKLESLVSSTRYSMETLEERLGKLDQERRYANSELQRIGGHKKRVEQEIKKIVTERDSLQTELSSTENGLNSKNQTVRALSSEAENERMELFRLRLQCDKLRDDLAREESSVDHLRKQLTEREEEKSQVALEVEKTKALLQEKEKLGATINSSKTELQSEMSELESRKKEQQEKIEESEKEIDRITLEMKDHHENIQELRIGLIEVDTKVDNLKERASDELGIDLEELKDFEKNEVDEEEVERLRAKIGSLEPVNMLAFQEFEEANERLKHLLSQKNDLMEAKESLKKTLKKMDRMARREFMDTFQSVQQSFKEIFSEIFDGGHADLFLEGDADPLRAEIQIVASPGRKKMSRIELLSSGERALIAISLLFALFLVRPSPFCILDEIDAPLDDANIGRFVRLLNKMSKRSQIALITHNKKTMESANFLYGITMEEPGVTKVVSVQLKEEEGIEAHPELVSRN